jgi:hypothetical protein
VITKNEEDKKEPDERNEIRNNGEINNHRKVVFVYGSDFRIHKTVLNSLKDFPLYGFSKKVGNKWYDVDLMVHTFKFQFLGFWIEDPVFYYHYWVTDKNDEIKEYIKPLDEKTAILALSKLDLNPRTVSKLTLVNPALVIKIALAKEENR